MRLMLSGEGPTDLSVGGGAVRCDRHEDAPGNDDSPRSLKEQLSALNGGVYPTAQVQAQWVENDVVDALKIKMPSYDRFKAGLHRAAQAAGLPLIP